MTGSCALALNAGPATVNAMAARTPMLFMDLFMLLLQKCAPSCAGSFSPPRFADGIRFLCPTFGPSRIIIWWKTISRCVSFPNDLEKPAPAHYYLH
jgi:hypothetical protein